MYFQRVCQGLSLAIFFGLLALAAYPVVDGLAVDFFLRMDPLAGAGTIVAQRAFALAFVPALVVALSCLAVGRVFCGHLCPMGTTLDMLQVPVSKKTSAKNNTFEATAGYRFIKYLFLAIVLGAAVGGVSLVHLGSPLSIVTRFYGTAIYPLLLMTGDWGLYQLSPVFSRLGLYALSLAELPLKVFSANILAFSVVIGMVALSALQPRFWCRNVCPAGALMALCARFPLIHRKVGDSCTRCGRCIRVCPTGAIGEDPHETDHAECIVCLQCRSTCPESAVSFGMTGPAASSSRPIDLTRRGMVFAAGSGLLTSGILRTSILQPRPLAKEPVFRNETLIRPPGAVPEPTFLARCIRCGECMKACPTNTLQPIWLKAGLEGILSPVMLPRLAACAVTCNVCGQVCPTGAIRDLSIVEKRHAKLGTAYILRQNCLAWEQDKRCLVCDEVCPYGAVKFQPVPERRNGVPFVSAKKCVGCGWCECKCPVEGGAAIRVNIIGEIRMETGSYVEKAREYGMDFKIRDKSAERVAPETFDSPGAPPAPNHGSTPEKPKAPGLPPGFIVE